MISKDIKRNIVIKAKIILLLFGFSVFSLEGNTQSILGEWEACSLENPKPEELDEIILYPLPKPSCSDGKSDYTITTLVFSIVDGKNTVSFSTKTVIVDTGPPYICKAASNYGFNGEWIFKDSKGTISFQEFNGKRLDFEIVMVSETELKLKRKR